MLNEFKIRFEKSASMKFGISIILYLQLNCLKYFELKKITNKIKHASQQIS